MTDTLPSFQDEIASIQAIQATSQTQETAAKEALQETHKRITRLRERIVAGATTGDKTAGLRYCTVLDSQSRNRGNLSPAGSNARGHAGTNLSFPSCSRKKGRVRIGSARATNVLRSGAICT
ncbi:MAG: hypothetical protein WDN67_01160 [Candidatus Moraniibacteriota bacterium]